MDLNAKTNQKYLGTTDFKYLYFRKWLMHKIGLRYPLTIINYEFNFILLSSQVYQSIRLVIITQTLQIIFNRRPCRSLVIAQKMQQYTRLNKIGSSLGLSLSKLTFIDRCRRMVNPKKMFMENNLCICHLQVR